MKITNTLSVKMNWDSFTFPILVGTPVSTAGVLANSAAAVGIVPRTVKQKPDAGDEFYLMTGGSIYLSEIAYTDLSVAAMQELDGIDFYKQNGHVQPKGGSGGGGLTPEQEALIQNAQWKTEGTPTTLFNETVTTAAGVYGDTPAAKLTYSGHITEDYVVVTFDGVKYVCPKDGDDYTSFYGAKLDPDTYGPVFDKYPFWITSNESGDNLIYTDDPGSHTVSVSPLNVTFNDLVPIAVAKNLPAATPAKIGCVKKAEFTGTIDSTEPVSGGTFINLLEALETAGLLEWNTIS